MKMTVPMLRELTIILWPIENQNNLQFKHIQLDLHNYFMLNIPRLRDLKGHILVILPFLLLE